MGGSERVAVTEVVAVALTQVTLLVELVAFLDTRNLAAALPRPGELAIQLDRSEHVGENEVMLLSPVSVLIESVGFLSPLDLTKVLDSWEHDGVFAEAMICQELVSTALEQRMSPEQRGV